MNPFRSLCWIAFGTASILAGCSPGGGRPVPSQPHDWSPPYGTAGVPSHPGAVPAAQAEEVPPSQAAAAAVAFALRQRGKRYCWGGTGPTCFDCSGLVYASYRAAGRTIPRSSSAQRDGLARVAMTQLLPGDILWRPGHVGLYVGDGWAVHAPGEQHPVELQHANRYQVGLRP